MDQVGFVESVGQAQNRRRMTHLGEAAGEVGTDALRWRIGLGERRMLRFQLLQFAEETVIFRVRDHGFAAHMVHIDVMMQIGAQFRDALLDVLAHFHCPEFSEIVRK